MAWVTRGLGAIFLDGSFIFIRHNLWMVLMEMFSRAGNRPFSYLAVSVGFLSRCFLMSLRVESITFESFMPVPIFCGLTRRSGCSLAWASRRFSEDADIWS